jgi:hypothetical protein
MSELDRSRAFGEIYGDEEGRRFEQDGQFFDGTGKLITSEAPKPRRKPVVTETPVVDPAGLDQAAAQLLS